MQQREATEKLNKIKTLKADIDRIQKKISSHRAEGEAISGKKGQF